MGAIYTKPPVGTQIDWTNPLTRNLVTCIPLWELTGRGLADIAGGRNDGLLTWDAPWVGSPSGPAVNFDGALNRWATIGTGNPSNIAIGTGTPHTMACVFRVTGYSGAGIVPGLITAQDLPFNRIATLQLYDNAVFGTAKLRAEMYDGTNDPFIQDSVDILNTGWHSAAWTLDGSTMALYRDGVLVGTQAYSINTIDQAGTNWYLGARPDPYGGAAGGGGIGFIGGISLALIARRAWAADEVRNWAGNPWQLFQSPAPWYATEWKPSTGATGSGAITLGSLAVAGTGRLTAPATGAVTLGALTVAGAGTFRASATGSVALAGLSVAGSATASAPGIVTGSGAITLGSLAVLGVGTFRATASGSVTLAGLTAAGAGSLTSSASGSVTLAGLAASGVGRFTATAAGGIALTRLSVSGSATAGTGVSTGSGAITLGGLHVAGVASAAALLLDAYPDPFSARSVAGLDPFGARSRYRGS